jgi:hypothetical protein
LSPRNPLPGSFRKPCRSTWLSRVTKCLGSSQDSDDCLSCLVSTGTAPSSSLVLSLCMSPGNCPSAITSVAGQWSQSNTNKGRNHLLLRCFSLQFHVLCVIKGIKLSLEFYGTHVKPKTIMLIQARADF